MQSLTSIKIILFLSFCTHLPAQTPKNLKDFNTILPPNCIPINDTLLCDQTEVSNLNWKEYTYYIKKVMGEESVEAKSAMSDQDGHMFKLDPDNGSKKGRIPVHKSQYHHYAFYDDYPVIGISLQQAKNFCTWRSNVVFEHFLVERNILESSTLSQNRDNHFTIDNYLHSEIAQENKHLVSHYPRYFIPSEEEWSLLKEKIQNNEIKIGKINSRSAAKKHQNKKIIPIQAVRNTSQKTKNTFYHILGNVSEMIDEEFYVEGGDYTQTADDILLLEKKKEIYPSDFVGFRCFFVWEEIDYELYK